MHVLYSDIWNTPSKPPAEEVANGTFGSVLYTREVGGLAILDARISAVTVQASNDGFESLIYDRTFTDVDKNILVPLEETLVAASGWRRAIQR